MTVHHVIVGAGPAATAAIETIRQMETERSRITLISDEPAHSRMAIPYWLSGKIPREQTHTADVASLQSMKVTARFGVRVQQLLENDQRLVLSDGSAVEYDRLLIATGSSPIPLQIDGADLPAVQHLWSLADGQRLLERTEHLAKPRVVLIGAGFVGMIVLNALSRRAAEHRRWDLAIVERESHLLPGMLDTTSADMAKNWLGNQNVLAHTNTTALSIHAQDGHSVVKLNNGTNLKADLILSAIGVRPNIEFVSETGLAIDNGILVDAQMKTSVPNIFAAGDVAQGPVLWSDQLAVHAIQPTAVDHGRVAGANMAGHAVRYPGSLLVNILDVCDLQFASMGSLEQDDGQATVISNTRQSIYRKLLWHRDRLIGAIFAGRAHDAGMLTDIGMAKGLLQTGTALGPWKAYLQQNPFDLRRPFIALGVAEKLAQTTLLGSASQIPTYRFQNADPTVTRSAFHSVLLDAIKD